VPTGVNAEKVIRKFGRELTDVTDGAPVYLHPRSILDWTWIYQHMTLIGLLSEAQLGAKFRKILHGSQG
jgi:hypothetical protein